MDQKPKNEFEFEQIKLKMQISNCEFLLADPGFKIELNQKNSIVSMLAMLKERFENGG